MIPGVCSHFNAWVDPQELTDLYVMGYRMARIDAMQCDDSTALSMVADTKNAGFAVIVVLADPERIRLLAPLLDRHDVVECENEQDGDWWAMYRGLAMWPATYRELLEQFCEVGLELGVNIGGPTCSNTNEKCIRWATTVRDGGWPKGMSHLTWHSYDPHENTKFAEMETLSDGMPIIISEWGIPCGDGITEEEQAKRAVTIRQRYAKYYADCWFQIHDGDGHQGREDHYGLLAHNEYRWKPVAYAIPKETTMLEIHPALRRSEAMPHPTRPGYKTSPHPDKDGTVLCVEFDRVMGKHHIAKRPAGTAGAWETWRDDGQKAVFEDTEGGAVAILLVD